MPKIPIPKVTVTNKATGKKAGGTYSREEIEDAVEMGNKLKEQSYPKWAVRAESVELGLPDSFRSLGAVEKDIVKEFEDFLFHMDADMTPESIAENYKRFQKTNPGDWTGYESSMWSKLKFLPKEQRKATLLKAKEIFKNSPKKLAILTALFTAMDEEEAMAEEETQLANEKYKIADEYKTYRTLAESDMNIEKERIKNIEDGFRETQNESLWDDIRKNASSIPWLALESAQDNINNLAKFMGYNDGAKLVNEYIPEKIQRYKLGGYFQVGKFGFGEDASLLPPVRKPEEGFQETTRDILGFMVPFMPMLGLASKGTKALKAFQRSPKLKASMDAVIADIGTTLGFTDYTKPNMANAVAEWMSGYPEVSNAIEDYLGTSPDNTDADNMLNQTLTAIFTGPSTDLAMKGVGKGLSGSKVLVDKIVDMSKKFKDSRMFEVLKNEQGAIKISGMDELVEEATQRLFTGKGTLDPNSKQISDLLSAKFQQEGLVNLKYVNERDDVLEYINTIGDVIKDSGVINKWTKKQTFDEVKRLANDLGVNQKTLYDLSDDVKDLAPRVLTHRHALDASAKTLLDMAKEASRGGLEDMVKFRRQVAIHAEIQANIKGVKTDIARALNAMKITAKSEDARFLEIDSIIEATGGADVSTALANDILMLAKQGNRKAVEKMVYKGVWARTKDAFMSIYINGLLSNPVTQMVNVVGNGSAIAHDIAVKGSVVGANKIRKMMGRTLPEGSINSEELLAEFSGMGKSVTEALMLGLKAFKSGKPNDRWLKTDMIRQNAISSEQLGKFAKYKYLANGVDLLGRIVDLPGRTLLATDEMLKHITAQGEIYALASREASKNPKNYDQIYNNIINNPPEAIEITARKKAKRNAFQETLPRGSYVKGMANAIENNPLLKIYVPFFQTPVNLFKRSLEFTPLTAKLFTTVREELASSDPAVRQLAEGKLALSWMFSISAFGLATTGRVTGGPPMDAQLRANKEATGWRPYSIRIGDKYYPYDRLDPVGMMFGTVADIVTAGYQTADVILNEDPEGKSMLERELKVFGELLARTYRHVLDKHYMKGMADFFDTVYPASQDQRTLAHAGKKATTKLAEVTPPFAFYSSARRGAMRAIDPNKHPNMGADWKEEMETQVFRNIPYYSKEAELAVKLNHGGEMIEHDAGGSWLKSMLSPISGVKMSKSTLVNEIGRLGVASKQPWQVKSIDDMAPLPVEGMSNKTSIPMSNQESMMFQYNWTFLNNELITPLLEGKPFKNPERFENKSYKSYKELPDNFKKLWLKKMLASTKKQAIANLWQSNPEGPLKGAYSPRLEQEARKRIGMIKENLTRDMKPQAPTMELFNQGVNQ